MKRVFSFLFVLLAFLLFVQVPFGLAGDLSFYEEFDQQEELKSQGENKSTDLSDKADMQDVPLGSGVRNTGEDRAEIYEPQGDFFLTDEKHERFLQENEQYALADLMLNRTWKLLAQKLTKKAYRKLWQEQKVWLDTNRNTVADSFKKQIPNIPESHAFMLATVVKTQELAQGIWHEPVLGQYAKDGTFVTLTKEDDKIFLQGYGNVPVLAKNMDNNAAKEEKTEDDLTSQTENAQEKSADETEKTMQADTEKEAKQDTQSEKNTIKTMPQLIFRAELPKEGKLWLALSTVNAQKLYLLTASNSLCIVHAPHIFSFDFNGIFVKK